MKFILLVGLGNLGQRYLQGLTKINFSFCVDVLEPEISQFQKLDFSTDLKILQMRHMSIKTLRDYYDICIVATTSYPRKDIILDIFSNTKVNSWLLEKVLAPSIRDIECIEKVISSTPSWVNTPRRLTRLYRTLKSHIIQKPFNLEVLQKDFSLGCNSIHYIDILSWLSDSPIQNVCVESSGNWFDAKRAGYKEFNGLIEAVTKNGSKLIIKNNCYDKQNVTMLYQESSKIIIDESSGYFIDNSFIKTGRLEFQSELTKSLVEKIILSSESFLPTLRESAEQHKLLLNAISEDKNLGKELTGEGRVPIS
jgi:hypothetical protein